MQRRLALDEHDQALVLGERIVTAPSAMFENVGKLYCLLPVIPEKALVTMLRERTEAAVRDAHLIAIARVAKILPWLTTRWKNP